MLLSSGLSALLPSSKTHQHHKETSDNTSSISIRMNTSSMPHKCTFQTTYGRAQSFRINTYKKTRGRGALSLTTNPKKDLYPEEHRDEGPLRSTKDFCPERPSGARDLSFHESFVCRGASRRGIPGSQRISVPSDHRERGISLSKEGLPSRGASVCTRRNARNSLSLMHLLHNSRTPPGWGVERSRDTIQRRLASPIAPTTTRNR
jgi:hypothetical protein